MEYLLKMFENFSDLDCDEIPEELIIERDQHIHLKLPVELQQ